MTKNDKNTKQTLSMADYLSVLKPQKKQEDVKTASEDIALAQPKAELASAGTDEESGKKIINKKKLKRTPQAHQKCYNTVNWLCKTFPKTFFLQNRLPLKVGILTDIFSWLEQHHDTSQVDGQLPSRKMIRNAMEFYTQASQYNMGVTQNNFRVDLEGNQVEEVLLDHKEFAENRVKRYQQKKNKFKNKKKLKHKKTDEKGASLTPGPDKQTEVVSVPVKE